LFVLAAIAEICGAWLVWQGVREHRGLVWVGAGIAAVGHTASWPPCTRFNNFWRVMAACGGIFVAGSLVWRVVVDGFRPDRFRSRGRRG
jgi:small multidrug resistance family-3 protein